MTPEERADLVMSLIDKGASRETIRTVLKGSIRAAEEMAKREEREECAEIAETWVDPVHAKIEPDAYGCTVALSEGLDCSAPDGIAAAIRARGNTP